MIDFKPSLLTSSGTELARISTGELIGDLASFSNTSHPYTVEATTQTSIYAADAVELLKMITPEVAEARRGCFLSNSRM